MYSANPRLLHFLKLWAFLPALTLFLCSCGNSLSSSGGTQTVPVSITTSSLPNGQIGTAYTTTLTAIDGTTPYTWSIAIGHLPAGLSLNASTGTITGTPTIAVTGSPLTIKVSDSSTPAATNTASLDLTIAPIPVTITTSSLPNGQFGTAYNATLAVAGGTAPYSWSLMSGTLPVGLTLNASTGVVSGTPTVATSAQVTFKVTDSSNPTLTQSATLTLAIAPAPLVITSTFLPNGQVGSPYSSTLAATGGTTPLTWSLTSGTLPAGLSLIAATGTISGTPTAIAAKAPLTFKVTDSGNPILTQSATLTLAIAPAPLVITTTSLPNGQVGSPYSATLSATGGTTPLTWSLTSGTLPAGLSLIAATGTMSGTPSAIAANAPLTFKVTDSSNPALTQSATLTLAIAPAPLVITTTSLPNGQVGSPYSATLAASGGTTPFAWSLTSGTLPAGLSLNAATGTINGTPTATVTNTPLTFTATDSGNPVQKQSANLAITISPESLTVSISPKRAGLTITQGLSVTATTNDSAGVNWNATGGSFSSSTSLTGISVTYTAPSLAGSYTLTATSVSDTAVSSSVTVYVTDLSGVYTYHNDLARDGTNAQEYALTTSSVTTSTFGKLFSCTVDGAVYAQPLWVANLVVNSAKHNVIFVATQHDSLYAFDADANPCVQLWQVSLIDTNHGANSGETTVPAGTSGNLVGEGDGDITPEVGATGTPVIDPSTNTLYVVSKSVNSAGTSFFQRLHAIDITTGNEKFSGPAAITSSITFPGIGDGGSTVSFNPRQQNQRAGLALVNGVVYVCWGSHEDHPPYYGWMIGFNASTLAVTSILNVSPNVQYGGIWMGGGAPSADAGNNLYVITGNATFDATNASAPNNDYGDSFLQLSPTLTISSYFSPSDQANDDANDRDFGAGGAAVVLNLTSGALTHLVIGGGKDGGLYLLNGDSMGGLGDANARQTFNIGHGIFATGAFWNNTYFIAGVNGPLISYPFNSSTNMFNTAGASHSSATYGFPGSTPSVSSTGSSNGIVWALDNTRYCTNGSPSCGPTVLHAYNATSITSDLWNSSMVSSDAAGNAVKFTVATVANGKVYVGNRGTNTGGIYGSTTVSGEVDVYGLKPN